MILNKIIASNTLHKVRQLESFCKSGLFAKPCRLSQLSRTSTILANTKQCLNRNVLINGSNQLTKLPTTTLGMQLTRKAQTPVGDHVRMWVIERIVATAMPIVIPAALMTENSVLDGIMSLLVVMHAHWGLEVVIGDYARPIVVGTAVPKFLHFSLLVLSGVTLCGLFILINNGPGVSRAIKDAWAIGKNPPPAATQ